MGKAQTFLLKEQGILEVGRMVCFMGKENSQTLMVQNMLENGRMGNNMGKVMEQLSFQTEKSM